MVLVLATRTSLPKEEGQQEMKPEEQHICGLCALVNTVNRRNLTPQEELLIGLHLVQEHGFEK